MFADIIKVFILSLVEGLTEFIPVSSTGHMIIVDQFLKEVDSLALANVHTKPHLNNRINPFTKSYAFY